jgi:hypothetical protein
MLTLFSGDVDTPGQLVQMVAAETDRQSVRQERADKDRVSTVAGKLINEIDVGFETVDFWCLK